VDIQSVLQLLNTDLQILVRVIHIFCMVKFISLESVPYISSLINLLNVSATLGIVTIRIDLRAKVIVGCP